MDTLEFIASLVNSLAWPAAVVVGILVVRRPILRLLPHVEALQYKEWKATFRHEAERLELKAATAELPVVESRSGDAEKLDDLMALSTQELTTDVLWYIQRIDEQIRKLWQLSNGDPHRDGRFAEALATKGIIDPSTADLITDLYRTRVDIFHHNSSGRLFPDPESLGRILLIAHRVALALAEKITQLGGDPTK